MRQFLTARSTSDMLGQVEPVTLTQFVAFSTEYPFDEFIPRWQPVASSFLRLGLRTITLAAVSDVSLHAEAKVAFISRNSWPAPAYRAAFPTGLAAEAAFGGVTVTQPGVFHALAEGGEPEAQAQPERDLVLALISLDSDSAITGEHATMLREELTHTIPDKADVTVYYHDSSTALQPVDLVVSVYSPQTTAQGMLDTVRSAIASSLDGERIRLLAGREVLTLTHDTTPVR